MTEIHCKYDAMVDPNTLVDHPRNHNKHPRRQLDALSAVVWGPKVDGKRDASKALGWRHAVVVSRRSGFVVMGHARKTVAIEEGELVPVVYQHFESEAMERAQLAADNRLAELAEMDVEALNIEVIELEQLDVPVVEFGFNLKDSEKFDPYAEAESGGLDAGTNEDQLSNKIIVHFVTDKDRFDFGKLLGQDVTKKTKFLWYPKPHE